MWKTRWGNKNYLLLPLPIFNELFNHGCSDDHNQRNDGADGGIRSKRREGQAADDKEVEVSHSSKLLKQRLGQETCSCILGGSHIIWGIMPNTGVGTIRLVANNHSWKTRSPNLWMLLFESSSPTFERVDLAQMQLLPSLTSHFEKSWILALFF